MARYGGGTEDFNEEARRLAALRAGREDLVRKEQIYQRELAATAGAEAEAQRQAEQKRRVRAEAREVGRREAAVEGVAGRQAKVSTADIEANTRARRENAQAARAQRAAAVDYSQALRGARDPLFARAAPLIEGGASQTALRRELSIGQARAARLQGALAAGLRPGGPEGPAGPLTRVQAALAGVARADAEYERARKDYTNAIRRRTATDEERVGALAARDAARDRRAAARNELESSRRDEVERQRVREERAQAVRRGPPPPIGREPGTELIRHPELFGRQAYAPIGREQERRIEERVAPGAQELRADERGMYAHQAVAAAARERAAATDNLAEKERQLRLALTPDELARHEALYADAARSAGRHAEAVDRSRRSTRLAAVEQGTASQAMFRHGALTTEFISAAARGEATLGQLGNQALVTTAKFAAWTGAAAAVYGALRAVQQLGEGAIQSASGVERVSRVIRDVDAGEARGAFRDLAQEFNVPIEVAADAVYRMGQRFHSLPQAVEAARASLYSLQTGEVDVATSTENLIAIVNGFGLEATQLTDVFDQINQAQNVFGVRIGDTEAGLAKAAGTWRSAGGELTFLLALMTAIGRATNRSGQEIGTGIARIQNFLRQESNVASLAAQGVVADPENIQETIRQALEAAKRPGADIYGLASGIFGPQYARLFTGVLQDQETFNEALKELAPDQAAGSAARELDTVLRQLDQEIIQIGVNIQRLGSVLEDIGAFDIFAGALKGLNTMLDLVVEVLEIFTGLPEPIQRAVTYLAQAAAIIALMRRFGPAGLSERFGVLGGAVRDPERRLAIHARRGLRDQVAGAYAYREQLTQRALRERIEAEAARGQVSAFRRDVYTPGVARFPKYTAEREALELKRLQLEKAADDATTRANATAAQTVRAKEIAVATERELANLQAVHHTQVRRYLQQRGIPIPAEMDVPSTAGATYVPGSTTAGGVELPRGVADPRAGAQADATRGMTRRGIAVQRALQQKIARTSVELASMGLSMGHTGRIIGSGLNRGADALGRGVSRMDAALASARSVPGRITGAMGRFARGIGILDALILAFIGYETIVGPAVEKYIEDEKKLNEFLAKTPTTRNELDRQRDILNQRAAGRGPGQAGGPDSYEASVSRYVSFLTGNLVSAGATTDEMFQELGEVLDPTKLFSQQGLLGKITGAYESPAERRRQQDEAARREVERRQEIERQQHQARISGRPVPKRFTGEIVADIEEAVRDRDAGIIDNRQFDRLMANYYEELHLAVTGSRADVEAGQRAYAAAIGAARERRQYAVALRALDDEGLQQEIQATVTELQAFGAEGGRGRYNLSRFATQYREAVRRFGGRTDAASRIALAEARQQYLDGLQGVVQEDLADALKLADTPGERRGAYGRARSTAGRAVRQLRRSQRINRAQIRRAQQQIEEQQDAYREAAEIAGPQRDPFRIGQIGALPSARPGRGRALGEMNRLRRRVRVLRRRGEAFAKELVAAERALGLLEAELAQQQYADAKELLDLQRELALSRTDDPLQQAKINREYAQRGLALAGREGGTRADRIRAQTEFNNANQEIADAHEQAAEQQKQAADEARERANAVARLQFEIQSARAEGDPVAQAHIAIAAARDAASRATTQEERLQALLDLINANNQLEEAVRDREQARLEYLASRTTDPARRARIERTAAERAVEGTVRGSAEYYRALARRNEARRSAIEERINDRRETIDFRLDMEQITTDVAITQYRSLLRTRGITRQLRRDLLRRIKELQREGESQFGNLDVGNIRLPTVYEIRRAAGAAARGMNVTQSYATTINVHNAADAEKVGSIFDNYHRGAGRAVARAAQVR